jgi:hypothetical protein
MFINLLSNQSVNESGNHAQLIRRLKKSSRDLPPEPPEAVHLDTTTGTQPPGCRGVSIAHAAA